MTRTDAIVKVDGMKVLLERLGKVDTERFISLIIREPFDYTKWQEGLFDGANNVWELSRQAMTAENEQ